MTRPIPINVAVEDELSEWIVRRILCGRPVQYACGRVFRRGGFGYLKKNVNAFCNLAKGCPVLLLTDLDKYACPLELITDWTAHPLPQNFMLRIAVREVESWLLGDRNGFSNFLRLKKSLQITNPENLIDPKEELLKNALKSPLRRIRDALVWRDKRTGKVHQGPDYNGTLGAFVTKQWDVTTASKQCHSLRKLIESLGRLENRI
jgi:hypothetical protein